MRRTLGGRILLAVTLICVIIVSYSVTVHNVSSADVSAKVADTREQGSRGTGGGVGLGARGTGGGVGQGARDTGGDRVGSVSQADRGGRRNGRNTEFGTHEKMKATSKSTIKPSTAKQEMIKTIKAKSKTSKPETAKPEAAKPATSKPKTAKPLSRKTGPLRPTAKSAQAKPEAGKPAPAPAEKVTPTPTTRPTPARSTPARPTPARSTPARANAARPNTVKPTLINKSAAKKLDDTKPSPTKPGLDTAGKKFSKVSKSQPGTDGKKQPVNSKIGDGSSRGKQAESKRGVIVNKAVTAAKKESQIVAEKADHKEQTTRREMEQEGVKMKQTAGQPVNRQKQTLDLRNADLNRLKTVITSRPKQASIVNKPKEVSLEKSLDQAAMSLSKNNSLRRKDAKSATTKTPPPVVRTTRTPLLPIKSEPPFEPGHGCPSASDPEFLHTSASDLLQDLKVTETLSREPRREKGQKGVAFLSNYRNPCWYEELPNNPFSYPEMPGSRWDRRSTQILAQNIKTRMRPVFRKRQNLRDAEYKNGTRLRCLPYLFILGTQEAGSDDLYRIIIRHPLARSTAVKDPEFWSGLPGDLPLSAYLDLFDRASDQIRANVNKQGHHPSVIVEASPRTYTGYTSWRMHSWVQEHGRQCVTLAHHLNYISPNSKHLLIISDPIDWLNSCFSNKWSVKKLKSTNFDKYITGQIDDIKECLEEEDGDVLYCSQKMAAPRNKCHVVHVMFYVWVKLWSDVMTRDRFMLIDADRFRADPAGTMSDVFRFLDLPRMRDSEADAIYERMKMARRGRNKDGGRTLIPEVTASKVKAFLRPWNKKLVAITGEKSLDWF